MSDINFNIAPANPMPGMMQALQFGQALGGIRDQRAQAAAQAEAARIAAEEKAAKDAQIAEAYSIVEKTPTGDNFMKLLNMLPPDQANSVRATWEKVDTTTQQAALKESTEVFAALSYGQPEVAKRILETRRRIYEDANNEDAVAQTQAWINMIDKGMTEPLRNIYGLMITGIPGGTDAIDAIAKFGDERRAEQMQPLNMEKTLADIGYTKAQTNKILAELEKMKATGTADPEQLFAKELQLNKEYTARTQSYDESLRLRNNINSSAESATGAGDLALINSFMKMLDPRSVVRESEFAQAQDTAGLLSKLAASLGRVQNGQVLVPAQRTEFVRLANEFMQAATEHEQRVRDGLNNLVKNYGLNPDNVFGTMSQTGTGTAAATGATPGSGGTTGTATPANAAANLAAMKALALQRFPNEAAQINAITSEDAFKTAYKRTYEMWQQQQTAQPQAQQQQAARTVEVDF